MPEKLSHRERKADAKEGLREFKDKYPTMKARLEAGRRGERPAHQFSPRMEARMGIQPTTPGADDPAAPNLLGSAKVIGPLPSKKATQAILDHAAEGET